MTSNDEFQAHAEISRDGLKADVSAGPQTVLAIAALVSGILLSTAVIVWVATAAPRKHPLISRLPHGH